MVDNSTIFQEILDIAKDKVPTTQYLWQCQIIIGATGDVISVDNVLSVNVERDYESALADVVIVELQTGMGTYLHEILPYKNDIKVSLTRLPLNPTDNEINSNESGLHRDYIGTIIENDSPGLTEGDAGINDPEEANRHGIATFNLQLRDWALESIRMTTINGIFRKTTIPALLRTLMRGVFRKEEEGFLTPPTLSKNPNTIIGVDIADGYNDRNYNHLIIPAGTRLTRLPIYLQEDKGIYSAGVGRYLQDGIWFVYPLYSTKRWNDDRRGLIIGNVPSNRMPGADKTFKVKGEQVFIIATGKTVVEDESENEILNKGNGIRYLRADRVIDGFAEVSKHSMTVKRSDNMVEFVAEGRENNLNMAMFSKDLICDNDHKQKSYLAPRLGSILRVVWENSDHTLLSPGMPVKYLYEKSGMTNMLLGTLLAVESNSSSVDPGMLNKKFSSNTVLSIFLEREMI